MISIHEITEGAKVTYKGMEKGIVKSFRPSDIQNVFVVFRCDGDWENYRRYTAALTPLKYLDLGWHERIIDKL